MIFSKSFGYAVRGVLYIAVRQDEKRYVQAEEIASRLDIPRHFMGKILKKLAKEGVLSSAKGPAGGFTINEKTLHMKLMDLVDITHGLPALKSCALRLKECNGNNPCPVHYQMENIKNELKEVLSGTRLTDLLGNDKDDLIKSISTETEKILINQASAHLK